ncbi:hypothetical protein BXZ70DRAFT_158368 [Cristinia sonorae]|uniref:RBR-type E3 ubiquitin transferase n=1 Tax=Cristinia sonorae TaxID=1940300 RepID=A0A8K0UNC3_9AGAR|nr:hypothetical protein BXZ70DRAFT_158368 [Cristinia sonorae]
MMADLPNPVYGGLEDLIQYITHLHLDDIEDLQARNAEDDTSLSDEELAKLIFAQEAESLLNITRDHIAGPSAAGSQDLIEELIAMEEMARFDHEVALAIAEDRPIPMRPESTRLGRRDRPLRPPSHNESEDDSDASTVISSSASDLENETSEPRAEPPTFDLPVPYDCTACGDLILGPVIHTLCGHTYDLGCLEVMFRKATTDESLFPPKCCQISIPLSDVEEYLDQDLVDLIGKKFVEFSTPDRVYCARSTCSAFLGPASTKVSALYCLECTSTTCGLCKEESHLGRLCTADLSKDVLDMATKEGWQRCSSCKHLVELNHGCFHITCICKAQFCYLCAAPWKTCNCPQFDEGRL